MSDFKLYEISSQLDDLLRNINHLAEINEGEIPESLSKELDDITMAKENKVLDIARYIKTLNAKSEAIKNEVDKLNARKKTLVNLSVRLKKYIVDNLNKYEKYEDSNTRISWRKSEAVDIFDEDKLPEEYFKIVKTPKLSEIKLDINMGVKIEGACIIQRNNLVIK